ncbi:MAG: TetR family transcriptional regulator [Ornithinimicrobium sp.]
MAAKRAHMPVEQRRVQLVEAAMEVMRREGAWALTTRAVAAQAGVPLGVVHYAFASKDALIGAVFNADSESATAVIGRSIEAGASGEQILRRAIDEYAEALVARPRNDLVIQELGLMSARDPTLEPLGRRAVEDFRAELVRLLTQVAEVEGAAWDARVEVLAESLFGSLIGLSQNWLCSGDDELLHACLADVVDRLLGRLS